MGRARNGYFKLVIEQSADAGHQWHAGAGYQFGQSHDCSDRVRSAGWNPDALGVTGVRHASRHNGGHNGGHGRHNGDVVNLVVEFVVNYADFRSGGKHRRCADQRKHIGGRRLDGGSAVRIRNSHGAND
jgi:hypothetical protein